MHIKVCTILVSCYSAAYTTDDQPAAADWHELMIPQSRLLAALTNSGPSAVHLAAALGLRPLTVQKTTELRYD